MIIGDSIIYMFLLPFSIVYLLLILSFFEKTKGGGGAKIGSSTSRSNIFNIRDAALVASALDIVAIIDEFNFYVSYANADFIFEGPPTWGLIIPISLLMFHVLFLIYIIKYNIDERFFIKESFSGKSVQKYQIFDKIINIYILFGLVATNAVTMRHIYGGLQ